MRNNNSNKLFGEIVPNSLLLWDPSIKPPSSRERRGANTKAWDNIPDVIRNSNIAADHVDYHRNFTAEIFEDLFEKLCANLKEQYGSVDIHMDGARYHKRQIEQVPSSNAKKDAIIAWLISAGIEVPENSSKAKLYELVKQNKSKVPFICVEIAKRYNLNLFYTPPYHCELQPIEGVWSTVKGEVARTGPHPNLLTIRNMLLHAFKEKVTSRVIVGLWKRSLNKAKEYKELMENMPLAKSNNENFIIKEIEN